MTETSMPTATINKTIAWCPSLCKTLRQTKVRVVLQQLWWKSCGRHLEKESCYILVWDQSSLTVMRPEHLVGRSRNMRVRWEAGGSLEIGPQHLALLALFCLSDTREQPRVLGASPCPGPGAAEHLLSLPTHGASWLPCWEGSGCWAGGTAGCPEVTDLLPGRDTPFQLQAWPEVASFGAKLFPMKTKSLSLSWDKFFIFLQGS